MCEVWVTSSKIELERMSYIYYRSPKNYYIFYEDINERRLKASKINEDGKERDILITLI